MSMIDCHACGAQHRTPAATGRCHTHHAAWIHGTGRWACAAYCHTLTITLHETRRDAENARTAIDRTACGDRCYRDHAVLDTRGMHLEATQA